MTTRLIEECFELEGVEDIYHNDNPFFYVVDPAKFNIDDLKLPMIPGRVIRAKGPWAKIGDKIHALRR